VPFVVSQETGQFEHDPTMEPLQVTQPFTWSTQLESTAPHEPTQLFVDRGWPFQQVMEHWLCTEEPPPVPDSGPTLFLQLEALPRKRERSGIACACAIAPHKKPSTTTHPMHFLVTRTSLSRRASSIRG